MLGLFRSILPYVWQNLSTYVSHNNGILQGTKMKLVYYLFLLEYFHYLVPVFKDVTKIEDLLSNNDQSYVKSYDFFKITKNFTPLFNIIKKCYTIIHVLLCNFNPLFYIHAGITIHDAVINTPKGASAGRGARGTARLHQQISPAQIVRDPTFCSRKFLQRCRK